MAKKSFFLGQNFNLGMVPAIGRTPAEKVYEHYVKKHESFGINYKTDTINGTLDGCTTNQKVGRLLKKFIQLCLAHGVQLGIVKTIYKGMKEKNPIEHELADEVVDDNDEEIESLDGMSDSDIGDESEVEEDNSDDSENEEEEMGLFEVEPEETLELNDEKYEIVINKLRKIINRYSGRSTPRGDEFQKAVKDWQKRKVN